MKQLLSLLLVIILLTGCKNNNPSTETASQEIEKSAAERIAEAHGFDRWSQVQSIRFNFSVAIDTTQRPGRTWTWLPKKDSVSLEMGDQLIHYQRSQMDSTVIAADRAFINDKFWLLIPFQLIWDSNASISDPATKVAPISEVEMQSITITYPNEGGYTPGDAYDIYYDENFVIKEWTYRKSNALEPSLSTTFEDYQDFNGLIIATSHKRKSGEWNLMFRDIAVNLE